MRYKSILVTGGAGFVGSNLAVRFKETFEDCTVVALDNLKRRGSELNLPRLMSNGVQFVHGDVRNREDLEALKSFDLLIDCAAEPSVHAGTNGSMDYVVNTNLVGTINSLEAARQRDAAFMLLSTSRVYPIAVLNDIPFHETATRYCWDDGFNLRGISQRGVCENFPIDGARSFYGASKLASELMVKEYAYQWKMPAIINRCGVLTGPWQMGKADQGVVTLWVARHQFQQPLQYIGFGGNGKQVRDMLHVDDLFELLVLQSYATQFWNGDVYNVGGGIDISSSLLELTSHCIAVTGNEITIGSQPETKSVDIRIYVTDSSKAKRDFNWIPTRGVREIIEDIQQWLVNHQAQLQPVLA